jgi:hypothetical protein
LRQIDPAIGLQLVDNAKIVAADYRFVVELASQPTLELTH